FSPGHRDLHRIFANPTESQLAEITQFFLRQPLSRLKALECLGRRSCHIVESANSPQAAARNVISASSRREMDLASTPWRA
ncbi:hypothetical protein, partial [Sinorhizobium meliloti]|uniref:hypothetical protein n=1 Tax=Rhizobium meliloti TaxID=382 RepID=UPI001AECD329